MSIGHIAVRPHSRAQGHSVAAAVAYRCGLALTCTRTGSRHDFARRSQREDVAAYGLARGRFESPAAFAAAVESAEKRRNSRLCRDIQMGLPAELDDDSRIRLTKAFAAELAERYDTATCWAVHRPDRRSDDRNHHAHIILPTRALADDGCTFAKKLRVLDDQRGGPEEITEIRRLWEARANEALIAAGQDARVHTGRTTSPAPTLGASHTAIERRAWQQRHTDFPNGLERVGGLSAARLVIDDGECATRRGRALAVHTHQRALGLSPESRPVRPSVPEAVQGLTHALVAVSPEPEPRPVRPRAPEAVQGLTHAVVAVSPVEEPRPIPAHGLEAVEQAIQQARAKAADREQAEEEAREQRRREALSRLHTAITADTTQAVAEALIEQHAGIASASPSFTGLGPKASDAAVMALRPYVQPYQVPERHRRMNMAARSAGQYLTAAKAAIERFQRRWLDGLMRSPFAELIVAHLRQVAEPIHLAESEARHERLRQITRGLAHQREREPERRPREQRTRPTRRPKGKGVER